MKGTILLLLLFSLQVKRSSCYYHVLVTEHREPDDDRIEESFFSHIRNRRSLADPDDIMMSLMEVGSGDPGDDNMVGDVQQFQFYVKNNDTVNSARTTISELMPGDAILVDFIIHNEEKVYRYDSRAMKTFEQANREFEESEKQGLSAVMMGDVQTLDNRCSDCRSEEPEAEAVAAVINIAPDDVLSVTLTYSIPTSGRAIESEKEIYRNDVTINLDESAQQFTGVLMSPNYPSDYPNNADLTWLIDAPTVDSVVSANLISFDTESCCDHLYVYDGDSDTSPLLYVVSGGRYDPESIVTTQSKMLVKFQTDSIINKGGFAMQFSPTEALPPDPNEGQNSTAEDKIPVNSTDVMTDYRGVIQTPNYPKTYPEKSVFSWQIVTLSTHTVDIEIIDFDVFRGESLQVINSKTGEVLETFVSGQIPPFYFNVPSNEVTLTFTSLSKVIPKRGLYAEYVCRAVEQIAVQSESAEWQTLTSPYYPNNYGNNEYKVWVISSGSIHEDIRLEVVSLNLEKGYDFLRIYNGDDLTLNNELATLSGTGGDKVEYMAGNVAMIIFETDGSVTSSGFVLNYKAYPVLNNCTTATETISLSEGTLRNPAFPNYNYYSYNCQWLLSVEEGKIMSIFVSEFFDSYAILTFYDGDSKSNATLWSSNGDNSIYFTQAITFMSSTNKVLAIISRTYSDDMKYTFRFQEEVDVFDPSCQYRELYTNSPGVITSPRYPLYSSTNVDCSWLIQAPTGYQVQTYIGVLNMNSYSTFAFYNGNNTSSLIRSCGCSAGYTVTSSSNSMLIVAVTSATVTIRFRLRYSFITESVTYMNNDIGSVLSPNFPSNYPHNSYEVYYIAVASGDIMFYFEAFTTEACCDHLYLYDGDATSSPQIATLSGYQDGYQSQTSGQYLTLEFRSDGSVSSSGFRMNYCATTQDCSFLNRTVTAYTYHVVPQTGYYHYLSSPGTSGYYPNNSDFYWYIDCPSDTSRMYFYFERVDTDSTDHLYVYKDFIVDNAYRQLAYGGMNHYLNGMDTSIYSRRALIWFHSDSAFNGLGFYLKYYCRS